MFLKSFKTFAVLCLVAITSCGKSLSLEPQTERGTPLQICSELDLTGVQWPVGLAEPEKSAFALALNITGSFEGSEGWANLTNDFDGQGMSMGLFQQNFGQGSLQPLLIYMAEHHPDLLKAIFSADHLKSLLNMLNEYGGADKTPTPRISILDIDTRLSVQGDKETKSVMWARNNLYVNGKFIPQWEKEFTKLAISPQYVSLQIQTAFEYHNKAADYFNDFGFKQIRAYLMLLDIVVQNGGLYEDSDIPEFMAYLKGNPGAEEKLKLEKLLELRLRHVKPQWVSDVRARKQTLIDGFGKVHGEQRNLEKQYCYKSFQSFH